MTTTLDDRISIGSAFAVPIAQSRWSRHADVNPSLRRLILEREALPGVANPHPSLPQQAGVFESQFDFFSWPDASIRALRDYVWGELARFVRDLNRMSDEQMAQVRVHSHTWFHVTRPPGHVVAHSHPMASWSGVYCVDDGGSNLEYPESGVLRFHNPHGYSNMFLDAGNARLRPPFQHGSWNIAFVPGQLVLFPSWLMHDVMPFHGARERITVAFNAWFSHADAMSA